MAGERLLVSPSCRHSGPGSTPIWTEATWEMPLPRLSVWQSDESQPEETGLFHFQRGVDPRLSGRRRPAPAAPFLAAGPPPLSTGTVPLPSLGTRLKDWSTQKPPVCLNPPQTPGNSQRRDFGGQRLTQRLVCPFFLCSCATGRGRSSTAAGQAQPRAAPPRNRTTKIKRRNQSNLRIIGERDRQQQLSTRGGPIAHCIRYQPGGGLDARPPFAARPPPG